MSDSKIHPVLICRQVSSSESIEYPAEGICNVKWDNISGGVHVPQAGYSLYGYIPYSEATELVDCSGLHDWGYNDAKICIRAKDNKDPRYREGYKILVEQAGPKPLYHYRAVGLPPCTKRILVILDEVGETTRGELREKLLSEGYGRELIRGAIKRLEKSGRISIEDMRNVNKQIIRKA